MVVTVIPFITVVIVGNVVISHSEYLTRNPVSAAYPRFSCTRCEVCIVQVLQCVLYKCSVCMVQGVQSVLCIVNCARYAVCTAQGVQC